MEVQLADNHVMHSASASAQFRIFSTLINLVLNARICYFNSFYIHFPQTIYIETTILRLKKGIKKNLKKGKKNMFLKNIFLL